MAGGAGGFGVFGAPSPQVKEASSSAEDRLYQLPCSAGLGAGRKVASARQLSTSHSPRLGTWRHDDTIGGDEIREDPKGTGVLERMPMPQRAEVHHTRNAPPPSTCVEPDYRELIHSVSWVLARRISDNEGFDSKKILPLFCEVSHSRTRHGRLTQTRQRGSPHTPKDEAGFGHFR